jgi:hypothetical protein
MSMFLCHRGDWLTYGFPEIIYSHPIYLSIYLSIHVSIFGSTAFCWTLSAFPVSWSFTQSVGHLGQGISPWQGRYLHTGQYKQSINAHRHPCLKSDSNPSSQCSSGRRRFMPQTARPLWSACCHPSVSKQVGTRTHINTHVHTLLHAHACS